jgi:hypothetical protein
MIPFAAAAAASPLSYRDRMLERYRSHFHFFNEMLPIILTVQRKREEVKKSEN